VTILVRLMRITLYTRPDCCLCDDARAALGRVRRDHEFELEEIDISGDQALTEMYGERVPVVMLDGVPALELQIEEPELRRTIAATAGAVT
jgi:glutaredoxin